MSDKMTQYFEAYYGTPIPLSKVNVLQDRFTKMILMIQTDIENHIPHASKDAVKAGLLEAMRYMNSTGKLDTPSLYITDTRVATEAFRYAIAAAEGKPIRRELITPKEQADATRREQEATRAMIEESNQRAEGLDEGRDSITSPLYKEYNRTKRILIDNGQSALEAKVGAYRALLGVWEPSRDHSYYIVGMKIPQEEGIDQEQEVIDMMNAHSLLKNLEPGPKRMLVNGKAWEGLK